MYTLKNKEGATKQAPIGFSITVLLFGFLVPLLRKDWKWAVIMLGVTVLSNYVFILLAPLVVQVVFAVLYNDLHLKELQNDGYEIVK